MAAQVDGGVVTPAPMTTPTPVPEINSYTVGVIVAVVGNIAVSFSYQVCLPRGGGMLSSAPPFEVKQQSERVSRPLQTSPAARSHARTHARAHMRARRLLLARPVKGPEPPANAEGVEC
jgi:hypothetical protein